MIMTMMLAGNLIAIMQLIKFTDITQKGPRPFIIYQLDGYTYNSTTTGNNNDGQKPNS